MATIQAYPRFKVLLDDGTPAVGYKIYSYSVGTSTLKNTYADQSGSVANANPTITDGSGECSIFFGSGGYKLVLADDLDNVIWTVDSLNVADAVSASSLTVSGSSTFAGISVTSLTTSSTAKVTNLNADQLDSADWAAPAAIGSVTPAAGSFTTLTASGRVTENADMLQQTANGASQLFGSLSEVVTLSTAGTTTDSVANLLPPNSLILGVMGRVQTSITTATDWKLGDSTTAARFCGAQATTQLIAGAAVFGGAHLQGSISTDATGPVQTSAAKVRITTTGTPGAGSIRITVFYIQFTAPTS